MNHEPNHSRHATAAEAEALAAQQRANRVRSANIVVAAMAVSGVIIFGLGAWLFFNGSPTPGLVMCVYATVLVPFLFWLRPRLISRPGAASGGSGRPRQ